MDILRKFAGGAAVALVVAPTAGCTNRPGETVEIISPTEGAVVSIPFEVTVEATVPLGSPDDGLHHVHIWFGDDETSYLVVEGAVAEITNAPPGAHEMHVSLRNPDHSFSGAETSIALVISGDTDG
jgi:hypothetical protein